MPKTISLTDLVINYINIDYENQRVLVDYSMKDANGAVWEKGNAIFWVTIPTQPAPVPDNWFQLPASYLPTLVSLRNDADTALTAKFLV